MINNIFEQALNIQEPWFIKSVDFDSSINRLNIFIDFKRGSTFKFINNNGEEEFAKAYDTKVKAWRHLNFFEHECYLSARVPRIKKGDKQIELIKVPWEGKMRGFTLLFEALVLQLCTSMPVLTVSQLVGVSDDKIWDMLGRYVDEALGNMTLDELKILGLDETSRKKNHNYITLFVDLVKKKIVHIAEGKDNTTVVDFVGILKERGGNTDNITDVSSDMSPAFIKGITENLPNAEITFDKFHILKIINEGVDEVRRQEAVYQYDLKGSRYIFLKNNNNLTKKQRAKLEELEISKINLKSIRALHIRENFQEIYNSFSLQDFEIKLKKWYYWATHSKLAPMIKVAKTIKKHWNGVLRWWSSKINNGILEGLNSIIQAAKAKARGYKLVENFKIIAYLLAGDIDLSLVNEKYYKIGERKLPTLF
jgi:transposase